MNYNSQIEFMSCLLKISHHNIGSVQIKVKTNKQMKVSKVGRTKINQSKLFRNYF